MWERGETPLGPGWGSSSPKKRCQRTDPENPTGRTALESAPQHRAFSDNRTWSPHASQCRCSRSSPVGSPGHPPGILLAAAVSFAPAGGTCSPSAKPEWLRWDLLHGGEPQWQLWSRLDAAACRSPSPEAAADRVFPAVLQRWPAAAAAAASAVRLPDAGLPVHKTSGCPPFR